MGRVYRRPDSGHYWISYSVGGRRFREAGGKRKAQAEALLAKRETEAFEGRHFPDRKKTGLTIARLRDDWLAHAAEKASLEDDRSRFVAIVEHFGATRQVATLRPADVTAFRAALLARKTRLGGPMAPATVNRHLALLRSALRTAETNGWQTGAPMRGVKFLDEDNERDRVCSPDEYEQLTAAAGPALRLAIVLGYWTAMRQDEIASLTWDRVDLAGGIAKLRSGDVKGKEGRRVPLPPQAVAALGAWPRRIDGRVFGFSAGALSSRFSKLVRELGIKDLVYHDLRHTALTRLRRAGVDIFTIQRISGHKTLEMLKRYQTITDEDLRAAVDRAAQ